MVKTADSSSCTNLGDCLEITKPPETTFISGNGTGGNNHSQTQIIQAKTVVEKIEVESDYRLYSIDDKEKYTALTNLFGVLKVTKGASEGMHFELRSKRIFLGQQGTVLMSGNIDPVLPSIMLEKHKSDQLTSEITLYYALNDPQISRLHVEIVHNADGTFLRDLNSLKGTWLNGKRLDTQAVPLTDGDEIRLGNDTELIFHKL